MSMTTAPANYPWWVRFSLCGVGGRHGLRFYVALCLALAAALLLLAYLNSDIRPLIIAPVSALAAVPYWLTIRWIDKNGTWK